jgi:Tfp pilus assembly protein PilW
MVNAYSRMRFRRGSDDSGFTLIELLVYGVLLGLALVAISSVFIGIIGAQTKVTASTATANAAQVTANTITAALRDSAGFSISTPTGSDQLLLIRSAQTTNTVDWLCQAWYYSASAGSIRYTTSSTAISTSNASSWPVLITGVSPQTGSTTIFSSSSQTVTIAFSAAITNLKPVNITTSVVSPAGTAGTAPCF